MLPGYKARLARRPRCEQHFTKARLYCKYFSIFLILIHKNCSMLVWYHCTYYKLLRLNNSFIKIQNTMDSLMLIFRLVCQTLTEFCLWVNKNVGNILNNKIYGCEYFSIGSDCGQYGVRDFMGVSDVRRTHTFMWYNCYRNATTTGERERFNPVTHFSQRIPNIFKSNNLATSK